ncbi:phospholipase D-like domain-containing protein [Paenibacillus agricola]|uniref:Phospholipase n=1 Tax=Paenibacillus agricola TaxID=2716264 RepID=A0ABX0JEK7_9BACL|nr:phospholipase D-like domain-containing protein [Paenibacillus agricola]NHN32130.1 phospholipase [Paenibacillus agricola]
MKTAHIEMEAWSGTLQQGMLSFINYYLSHGPLDKVVAEAKAAVALADEVILHRAAERYRQELGGILTSTEQLLELPGMSKEVLEQLAHLVSKLDLAKLHALVPQTTWNNRVDAYLNGPDCLQLMLEEIHNAKHYIHLSVMLFYNDDAGNRIAGAMLDALRRGVTVRIMVDYGITAVGYDKSLKVGDFTSIAEQLKQAGGMLIDTFHACYPKGEWSIKRAELAEQGVPESSLFLQDYVQEQMMTGTNMINHRKFMVIDGITAVLGSLNIGDQYLFETPIQTSGHEQVDGRKLGVPSKVEQWHDGCCRIQGAAIQSLNQTFAFQWTVHGGDVYDPCDSFYYPEMDRNLGEEQCTLFTSFPGNPVNLIQQYYLSLITYVSDETIIVNPYLIDQAFWDRLKSLGEEQARHLTLCNPLLVNDHPTNQTAVRSQMYEPFLKGVSFYDYSQTERFSHWKITYDHRSDCVFHGSYNINERSACHDFEIGVLVKSKPFANKVKKMIDYDLSMSRLLTESQEFYQYPALHPSTYLDKWTKFIT